MLADPISLAVVLGALVVLLQTKFELNVKRVGGKLDVELRASKSAMTPKAIGEVIAQLGKAITP